MMHCVVEGGNLPDVGRFSGTCGGAYFEERTMMIGEARQEYLTNKRTMKSDSAANALLPYGPTTGWNVPLGGSASG